MTTFEKFLAFDMILACIAVTGFIILAVGAIAGWWK
jgi:hypothetical protein